jgi:hypothetical protein
MVDVHGKMYPIKKQRGRLYIQHATGQLTVTKKLNDTATEDWCFAYIFQGLSVQYPCPAIDYFIYRHRLGNRITAKKYKEKFNIKP